MIDDSDGDFFALAGTGSKGLAAVVLLLLGLILWALAAWNSAECGERTCPGDQRAKLLDHECVCVTAAPAK